MTKSVHLEIDISLKCTEKEVKWLREEEKRGMERVRESTHTHKERGNIGREMEGKKEIGK